jgi:hypothetical protein
MGEMNTLIGIERILQLKWPFMVNNYKCYAVNNGQSEIKENRKSSWLDFSIFRRSKIIKLIQEKI